MAYQIGKQLIHWCNLAIKQQKRKVCVLSFAKLQIWESVTCHMVFLMFPRDLFEPGQSHCLFRMGFVAQYEKIVELEGQQSKLWEPCSGQVYMSTVHQNYGNHIDGKKTVILM